MRPSFTLVGVLLLLLQQGLCSSQESRFATVRRLAAARDVLHRISEPQDLILGSEMTRPLFSWDLSPTDIMPEGQLQSSDLTPANVTDTEDTEKKDKKTRGKKKKKKKKNKKQQNNNHIVANAERDDESAVVTKVEDRATKAKKAKLDRKKKEKRRRRKEKQEKRKKQEQRANNLVPIPLGDTEPSKKNRNKTHHKPVMNNSELVPSSPSSGENDVERFRKMSTIMDNIEESNNVPLLDPLDVASNPLNTSPHDKNEAMDSDKETDIVGDLSCLQGRFLPAPPVEHAVIKYVRGSFLEAEYECELDYKLEPEGISKLVCKEYEWLGHRPSCISSSGTNKTTTICKSCEHLCTMEDGQPKCSCYRGFILQGSTCQDIDECAIMNGGCEGLCHNTLGSYQCLCAPGFRLADNGKHCVDINECLLRNGHGPCQDSCENLPGSYRCSCEGLAGTRLAADNHTCEDLDECSRNNAGCSHICLNTLGRAFCLCPPGFMLGSDWKTCNDIDECEDPDLQEGEICSIGCINTIGSYHCIDLQDEARPPQPQSETGMIMTTTTLPLTTMSSTATISVTSMAVELESTTTEASTYPTTQLSTTEMSEMDSTTTAASITEVPDDMGTSTITEPTTTLTTDTWESDLETTLYTTTEQSTTDVISTTEPSTTESWLPSTEISTTEATTIPVSESTITELSTTEAFTQELTTTTTEMLTSSSTTTEMLTTVPTTTPPPPTPTTTTTPPPPPTTTTTTTTTPLTTTTTKTTTDFTTTTATSATSTTPSLSTTTAPVLCPPGFKRGENNKCEDVNECAVGNGGCSHTCYNSLGRAFCLCPPGFMLSSDWKTCKAMEIQTTRPPKVFVACPPGYRANSKGHCKDVDECIKQNGGCSHGCINTRGSYRCVCGRGFFLGADRRTCIKEDLDVVCPPLSTPPNGYLHCIRRVIMAGPERWRARWRRRVINHAGTVCDLRCPHGYKLQGDFHKVCDGNGKWSGPEEGTCIPVAPRTEVPRKLSVRSLKGWQSWYATDLFNYILVRYAFSKPRIQCPDDIIAELEPGHEKAFVAFPQPDTNMNWFRDVISRPRWGKMLEADLRPGQWKVTFTAIEPVTRHSSSCTLLITVVAAPG